MNVFSNINKIKSFDIHRANSLELKNYISLIDNTQNEISRIIKDFYDSDEEWDDVVDTLEENDYHSILEEYKNMALIAYDNLIADENGTLSKEEKNIFLNVIKKEKSLHSPNSRWALRDDKYIYDLCQKVIDNVDNLNYTDTEIKYIKKIISQEIESLHKGFNILDKEQSNERIQVLRNIEKKINNQKK